MPGKILLVDGSAVTLSLNSKLFEKEGYEVFSTSSGEEALAIAKRELPDCIVTDALLKDDDGFDLARRLRELCPSPILFLTSCHEDKDIVRALSIGDDLMTKPYSLLELSVRVRNLIRRKEHKGRIMDFGALVIHTDGRSASMNGRKLPLTSREFEILLTLAERENTYVKSLDLYKIVWNDETTFTPHVVMVNISTLRKKMERLSGGLSYIRNDRGKGYIFLNPPEKTDNKGKL